MPDLSTVSSDSAATNRFLNCLGDPTVPDRYLREAEDALRAEVAQANWQRLIVGLNADINELVQDLEHGWPRTEEDRATQQDILDQLVADRDYLTDNPPARPPSRFEEPSQLRGNLVSYLARLDRGMPYQTMQVDPGCVLASRWDPATLAPDFASPDPEVRGAISQTLAGDLPEVLDLSVHSDEFDQPYADLAAVTAA